MTKLKRAFLIFFIVFMACEQLNLKARADDLKLELYTIGYEEEKTIYAGGNNSHIGFWEIDNYDMLQAAWGGEPVWSISGENGEDTLLRWSNTSIDGKSIWLGGPNPWDGWGTPTIAQVGDYIAILSCKWNEQIASARIVVHVVEPVNGPLQGSTGLEDSYTIALNEELPLQIKLIPEDWSLPGEEIRIEHWATEALTPLPDGQNKSILNSSGQPFFHIEYLKEQGSMILKGLQSGIYMTNFYVSCANYSYPIIDVMITVLNEDGSVPADPNKKKADEVIAQIKALPEVISKDDVSTVKTVGEAYESLTEDQRNYIAHKVLKKLSDAEIQVYEIEQNTQETSDNTEDESENIGNKVAIDGYLYKLSQSNLTAILVGFEDKSIKTITIPATVKINGEIYSITEIADNACQGMSQLTKVTIGKNVTTIGKKAFYGDKKLTTISGGKGLVTISASAFQNCAKLKTVPTFSKLVTIGDSAFQGCTTLAKFTIGAKVKTIGKKTFYGDKKLKTITIKSTLLTASTVKSNAFKGINSGATIKCPKKKVKDYTAILQKKGVTKNMTIK